jgi:hypothetical protein
MAAAGRGGEIMSGYAYIYRLDDERWNTRFYSLSDALRVARVNNPGAQTVYIAETNRYEPPIFVDRVIESLRENAYEIRPKSSDDFLRDLTDQECKELKDALTVAFVKWAHDTGNPHWIEVPIEGTEHLYDLKTGRRVE